MLDNVYSQKFHCWLFKGLVGLRLIVELAEKKRLIKAGTLLFGGFH